jgi:hypothetical protein
MIIRILLSMYNTTRALLFLLLLLPVVTFGQVSITNASPSVLLNFSNSMPTTAGTNPSTSYTGAGFSPNPTIAGRLNSNAWEVKGFSFGTLNFGGTQTVDAFGRGSVTGGVVTHGIYAFTELPGSVANPALMVQPSGTEFSPGSITLRIRNNGTSSITQLQVEYDLFVRNDENKSSSFNFSHSLDNVVYQDESMLDFSSPETADALEWVSVGLSPSRSIIITGLNIAPGAFYYLRWSSEELSGSGNSDEFGLDDIRIIGTYGTPAPEINVTCFSTTILHNDTIPSISDGTQYSSLAAPTSTLSTSVSRTFEIQNLGGAVLTTSGVTITGLNPGDFTVFATGTDAPGPIAAVSGGVISLRQLTIVFDPSAPGLRRAIVNIASDDANENPYVFHIQGYGFDPVPEIDMVGHTGGTAPILDGSLIPNTGNNTLFDPQTVGVTNQTKDFRIRNVGTLTLLLTDPTPYVTISGANPGDFTLVTTPTSGAIIPGSFRTFSINFNPSAPGIRTAMVSIANNDSNENPYNFLIQGNGITPEADIFGNGQPIASGSTIPTFVNDTFFDYINVTSGTIDRVFTIQNTGTAVLTIGAITISGAAASDYTVISLPTSPLAVGASTTFAIRFDPSAIGLRDALVTIINNDLNENPYTFAISGYGLDYTGCDFGARETIAIQDFETTPATPTWGYTLSGATATLTTGVGHAVSGDSGLSSRFLGATALQNAGSGTGVLTMSNINTTTFSDVELNVRLGAYSTSLTNGLDNTDRVIVAVSTNGGTTWSNEVQVQGLTNSVWNYTAGIGTASKNYTGFNVATVFAPTVAPSGINYQTTEGYSTIVVSNLPKVANLAIRVSLITNSAQEIWAIDNVTLFGRKELTSTWDGSTWSNGQPTSGVKAILDADYNTSLHGNLLGCKCQINTGRNLTIDAADYALIESDLQSSGTITIENAGSLVQRNDFAINSGNLIVKRTTSPMKLYDYTYWSSPVGGQTLTNLSPQTSPDRFYAFNPTAGNWQYTLGTTVMAPGKGYIVRSPESFTATAAVYNAQFAGSNNNGFIQTPIVVGASPWNLIGNPYASAIDADLFLGFASNTGLVGGTIYLWTHNTAFANNVYTVNDYAVYNLLGGVGTAATNLGVNNTVPSGMIASGQGFFIQGLANGNVTFNNTMRVTGNNTEFFRSQNSLQSNTGLERHRIWLNLTNTQGAFKQTLIGYVQNATNELDRDFDGSTFSASNVINFYSLCLNKSLAIQGRALPFANSDMVPLGYSSNLAGEFSISLENFDGLFTAIEGVYLEDRLQNVIHNLKTAPYTFTTTTGTFNSRFVLRFTNQTLSDTDFESGIGLIVASNNHQISLLSDSENIASVAVYDILGRRLLMVKDINRTSYQTSPISNPQTLIVKVTFVNGVTETRKVILQ